MTEIPWSIRGKAAMNFRNKTRGRPKTIIFFEQVNLESHRLSAEQKYFLSYVISEIVDSVDLAFVYLFLVHDR